MTLKPRLLYILHAFFNRGGTEEHTRVLAKELKESFDIWLLFPHQPGANQAGLTLLSPQGSASHFLAPPPAWPETPKDHPPYAAILDKVLAEVKPNLVHVQHFIYWPLSLLDQVAAYGQPWLTSFHDYYAITPVFTLQLCNSPTECFSPDYSKRAFNKDIGAYLMERKLLFEKSIAKCPLNLTPSNYAAQVLQTIFPVEFKVIEHGIAAWSPLPKSSKDDKLRFGFVGSLLPQKGWDILLKAFQTISAEYPQAELHFFGGRAEIKLPNVFFHGVYDQPALPRIMSLIDVGIIPSVFPETFGLVLSEFWQGQVPVAVSDIGAFKERVQDGLNGKKFKPNDVTDLADTLKWFLNNPHWRHWKIPTVQTAQQMADKYRALYLSLL